MNALRILGAVSLGIVTHFTVSFGLALLLMGSMEVVTPEDPELHDPPETNALLMWSVSFAVCRLPSLAGGAVAGRLAQEGWLVASGVVAVLGALHADTFLNGPGAQDARPMVVLVMIASAASAVFAGFLTRPRRSAEAIA